VSSATDPVREDDHRSSGTGAARRIGLPNLNPVRLYERWEAAAALMSVSASVPDAPYRMLSHLGDIWRWRSNPAGIVVLGAARNPTRIALVDDDAEVTFAELDRRTNAVAASWRAAGLGEHSIVGVLARNGRLFMEASIAATKLGADVVYLNGSFAPAQVADVVAHEGIDVLFYDDELAPAAALASPTVAVTEAAIAAAGETGNATLTPPSRTGRVVVLTSGTTGRPKGAGRDGSTSPGKALDAAGILSCIPFAPGERAVIAAPLFHGLGLFTANLSAPGLGRRYCAGRAATLLVAVPVMLQRILELPRRTLDMYDTSSLRLVISGGAALAGELAQRFMDRFGDVLYNVYGSSETALATVALPRDLRAAPGTAGHPVPGVKVAILDDGGRRVPNGATGRVFVGSPFGFDGYTGGGSKDVVAGMLATGDLGHLDRRGRLSIDGREDDMIVSGGENVFPGEVEDLLSTHAAVAEVSVIGVADPDYGQRLRAFVVPRAGATATAEELRDYVHDRLARFKTPREIVFVSTLPRTATGKVLKRELRTMEVESQ
jgi:acyl-CoA synthetase (AMP-forming)/AMP-acid ligase II